MEEKIKVYQESELEKISFGAGPGIGPILDRVKKEILTKPKQAALLSEVVKALSDDENGDAKAHASLSGKFKRYCEKGAGDFKIVSKDGKNVLVRTA